MDNFIGQLLQDTNGMNPSFMRPSSPTTTATQAAPQRKRASVIDILGGLADAVATVGGSEPMYQPTLDAATERQRQTEADQMARQKFDLGKQQAGLEIQDQRNKLLVPAVAGLEAAYRRSGVEGLKKALPIAAQMFGVSPEQMQMLSASFDQDPEGTFTALHGLAGQAAEMKFIEGPDGTYAVDPRNPTMAPVRILGAKPTEQKQSDDIREYEYAFQNVPPEKRPAFTDWMRQNKSSGATRVNIAAPGQQDARWGEAQPGFSFVRGPNGEVLTEAVPGVPGGIRPIVAPMGGTKEAYERGMAGDKKSDAARNRFNQANIVLNTIGEARDLVGKRTTGIGGAVLGMVPGTEARDLNAKLDTIKANVGFDKLQQMRDASPTGGALGPVSDVENRLLQSSIASVDPTQSGDALKAALDRTERVYEAIINEGPDAALREYKKQGGKPKNDPLGLFK